MSIEYETYLYSDNVICPHCGFEDDDHTSFFENTVFPTDGDKNIYECGECSEDILVTLNVIYKFDSEIPNETEKERFG